MKIAWDGHEAANWRTVFTLAAYPPMAIKDWPASERPREKLVAQGAGALSDAELLAVLLGSSGRRGIDAVAVARALLAEHQSLRQLLCAGIAACRNASGLGFAGYCRLQACLELARRHYEEALRFGPALQSPTATREFLIARLRDTPHELFCCLHLDNRHRLLAFEVLFRGTIDGASVHPREVVKQALAHNAAAMILAHNHPSGVPEPSRADELITRRLREALQLVDIPVLDHLIVAGNACVSLAERGLI
jgi:DNA repair protein RadC